MSEGTQIVVVQKKWFSKYKNGSDFTELPSDFTVNMISNAFERLKYVATLRTWTRFDLRDYYITDQSITISSGDFPSVSVGDRCIIFFSGTPFGLYSFTIESVKDNIIYYKDLVNTAPIPLPSTFAGVDTLIVVTDLTYLNYKWGLTPTNNTPTYQSYLDGQTLSYKATNIGERATPSSPRDTSFVNGAKSAVNSNAGSFRVRYVGQADIPYDNVGTFQSAQDYEIEHEFVVQNFSENQIENIINSTLPDEYLGEVTLDYDTEFEFRTIETAPETSKISTDSIKGDLGFFGENFNDRPDIFSISDVEIRRVATNELLDNLASNEECQVSFTINSDENSFNINPTVIINHFTMRTDFVNVKEDFETFFNFEDVRIQGISNSEDGLKISNALINTASSNSLFISFNINISDISLEGVGYFLSVNVGDFTLDSTISNRSNKIVKTGRYQDNFDVLGLIGQPTHDLYLRDCTDFSIEGATSFPVIKAELLMTKIVIPILDGVINSIDLQTLAIEEGDIYVVDSTPIDISGFSTVNGVQEINEILTNPYLSTISDGSFIHLGNKEYELIYPFRMPYDEDRAISVLPDSVFNSTLPNNGKNEDVFYLQSRGLEIHIAWRIGIFAEGRTTFYRYRTPPLTINNFEQTL